VSERTVLVPTRDLRGLRMNACARATTVVLGLFIALCGCGVAQRMTGEAARKQAREEAAKEQSQALQQEVMRFADLYVERVVQRTEQLAQEIQAAELRLTVFNWQFTQATAAVQIAAGPNPVANAVDMVVLVSLNRRIVETSWVERYGDAASVVVRSYQSLEQEAWQLLDGVGTPAQLAELDAALSRWSEDNPGLETAAFIRFADFAGLGAQAEVRVSPGLLGIVGLDPLEGIDPAVREFEQTRLLAERAVYYGQRLPILFDIQIRQMAARFAETPETRNLLATVNQVGELSAAVARLTEQTPVLLAREREAAIAQFMAALEAQQRDMLALTTQLKAALEAGTLTARSLDAMVQSTDRLVGRFKPDVAVPVSKEPSRPFDINEYTRSIVELANTARELQALVENIEGVTPQLAERIDRLTGEARVLVDHAFWRILFAILAVLVAAILYRLVASRLARGSRS
jgi:hypothetical protein